jgi:putative acetyltransferase
VKTYVNLTVRREHPADWSVIRVINEAAFNRRDEADLVDGLRTDDAVLLSLVAALDKRVVGHVLFSRIWIEGDGEPVAAAALAPIAVLPSHQRRGIGEQLIRNGLDRLREQHEQIVIVLGHPDYYSRFGFSNEKARSLESPFPPEAFLALELFSHALNGLRGKVRYPAAFGV